MADEKSVLEALRQVVDPGTRKDLVALGAVRKIRIDEGRVFLDLVLPGAVPREKENWIKHEAIKAVREVADVKGVLIDIKSSARPAGPPQAQGAPHGPPADVLPDVKYVVAVASGKGGVGKSTVATNLAIAIARTGAATGLLDADVYGPSAPTMMGVTEQPQATSDQKILPIEKHGLKMMSMGFLSTDDTPIIWRGPMVHSLISQFLRQVEWGALDYLVIDMPPGTGDAQLTLTQLCPLSGAVIVSTPQEVALIDARKGLRMFQRVNVPVLGLVENMSYFACPHCDERTYIFRKDGGKATAKELEVELLGEVPIDPAVAVAGDEGLPIVARDPSSPGAVAFQAVARRVLEKLSALPARKSGVESLQW